jgi:undecaprenyl-diphosphatase
MDTLLALDQSLFLAWNGAVRWPWFEAAMRILSAGDLGRILFAVLAAVLVVRDWRRGLLLLLGAAITITLSDQLSSHVIKPLTERPRPCNVLDPAEVVLLVNRTRSFSFPSSHATNSFAGALYFSAFMPSLTVPLFVLAALISFSRIAVGVHYPLDVAAGAAIGLAVAALVLAAMRRFGLAGRRGAKAPWPARGSPPRGSDGLASG